MNPFQSVKNTKISARIAQQIKSAILSGEMNPGDKLPPERELVGHFQASRISVREAVKGLETAGLLIIKPGAGIFVAEMNSKSLSESLSSILRMKKTSIHELTEARAILEPSIARLASQRMTTKDLERLEANVRRAEAVVTSRTPSSRENIEFHSLIAESTHNPVVALTMQTLFDVIEEMTLEIKGDLERRIETSRKAVAYHKKLLGAFRKKDAERACRLMTDHVLQMQKGLEKI